MKPIISKKQFGQLLLGWAIIMAALFLWELAEIGGLVPFQAMGLFLRPLSAAIFAVWLAIRHARGETQIDWRGCCILLLIFVVLLFAANLVRETWGLFWLSDRFRHYYNVDSTQALFDYYYQGGIRWNLRWIFYWFAQLCFLDIHPHIALALEFALYPIVKIVCIRRSQRRSTAASIAE